MIPHFKGNVPFIDTTQMKEVDRLMVEEYSIGLTQMMENAGLSLALLAKENFLKNKVNDKEIIVCAGSGGNSGGALVAARRLKNWGADVKLILSSDISGMKTVTKQQYDILDKMKIKVIDKIPKKADLIIDGIIGYNINGDPKGRAYELIEEVNKSGIPVLSLDTPSGLDLNTGIPGDPTIKANATLTLALPKRGLYKLKATKLVGDLFLADISVPPQLYKSIDIEESLVEGIFALGPIVKINKLVIFN